MSLAFSDTTNKDGIIQLIERIVYGNDADGRISGNSTLLKQWTGDVNLALDQAFAIIFDSDGTWQFDDTNHTDYPIITTNLVASQRDYSFTTDENSNLILEIERVLVADTSGIYQEVKPKDSQTESDTQGFWDGNNTTGQPKYYDKLANGIFLDPIPASNVTNGLKIYISREASYFVSSDTTKKPGIAGFFHEYIALLPAYKYALRNNLANARALQIEVMAMEEKMKEYYGRRNQDERKRLTVGNQDNR